MMSSPEDHKSIDRFCRQYLQLERDLDYPSAVLLREEHIQDDLYRRIFADGAVAHPPPPRYQLRVLKELVKRIEASIEDWDQHVCIDADSQPMQIVVMLSFRVYRRIVYLVRPICPLSPTTAI